MRGIERELVNEPALCHPPGAQLVSSTARRNSEMHPPIAKKGCDERVTGFSAAEFIVDDGRPTYVYILGDFDPSGLCAAEKVGNELTERAASVEVHVEHLAVTHDQDTAMALKHS